MYYAGNGSTLSRLNGWRRLWLVLTAMSLLGALGFSAYAGMDTANSPADREVYRTLKSAIDDPACGPLLTTPFKAIFKAIHPNDIAQPCWFIYNTRSFDQDAPLPYSIKRYSAQNNAKRWFAFWTGLAILVPMVLVCSALLYFAGWVVAWIRRGFQ